MTKPTYHRPLPDCPWEEPSVDHRCPLTGMIVWGMACYALGVATVLVWLWWLA